MNWLKLIEHQTVKIPKDFMPDSVGVSIWKKYSDQIAVEFPSPKTGGDWQFTANGWVGYIPVTESWGFELAPKVPINNIFRMLEYAFDLNGFQLLDENQWQADSLNDLFDRFAALLASLVLNRCRKGLYRGYVDQADQLPYVSGRLDTNQLYKPWTVKFHCSYQDHLSDLEENQLLLWTLHSIVRTRLCSNRVLPMVREAYRSLSHQAQLKPFSGGDCINRLYNRLNQDYQPMHALCRFFLEHCGPSHKTGEYEMVPFIGNMSRLFERFVAKWLQQNLLDRYTLRAQEHVNGDKDGLITLNIDLVIYDNAKRSVKCVLDTKYKRNEIPQSADFCQIVTYAASKQCGEGYLIYPFRLAKPLQSSEIGIKVASADFPLGGDLEQAGQELLAQLGLSDCISTKFKRHAT